MEAFIKKEEQIKHILGTDNDLLVSLTAVLHFQDIIDKEKKANVLKLKGSEGAECLFTELKKVCENDHVITEIIIDKMKGEKKLQQIMKDIEMQKAEIMETKILSHKGRKVKPL